MEQASDSFFATLMDLLLDAVCAVDAQGHFVFVNAACASIFGYTQQEMLGRRMIDMVAPEDREKTLQAAQRVMSGQSHLHFENRYVRKDGSLVDLMWSARWSPTQQLRIAVARDVSARKRAELMQAATYAISEAAHATEDMCALFEHIHVIIDRLLPSRTMVVAMRDEASQSLEYAYCVTAGKKEKSPDPLVKALCVEILCASGTQLFSPDCLEPLPLHLRTLLAHDDSSWLGTPLRTHQGVIGALLFKSQPHARGYRDADKELLHYIATQVASAIERKRLYASLQHMAQYDALTGLPNRRLLQDRLRNALTRARRGGHYLSVLYLDINHFKEINDTLGHAAGDALLQAFARRLQGCLRACDTVARMGGDEFVVLLESSRPLDADWIVRQKLQQVLDAPYAIEGHCIDILPSIGIANFPEHGNDEHALLRHADSCMYTMKKAGHFIPAAEEHATAAPRAT